VGRICGGGLQQRRTEPAACSGAGGGVQRRRGRRAGAARASRSGRKGRTRGGAHRPANSGDGLSRLRLFFIFYLIN